MRKHVPVIKLIPMLHANPNTTVATVIGVEISIWRLWLHQKKTDTVQLLHRVLLVPKPAHIKVRRVHVIRGNRTELAREGAVLLRMHNCFSHKHRVVTGRLDPRPLTGSCSKLTGPEGGWWLLSHLYLQFDSWFQLEEHPVEHIPLLRPNSPLLRALIDTNHIDMPDRRSTHHSLVNEPLC